MNNAELFKGMSDACDAFMASVQAFIVKYQASVAQVAADQAQMTAKDAQITDLQAQVADLQAQLLTQPAGQDIVTVTNTLVAGKAQVDGIA